MILIIGTGKSVLIHSIIEELKKLNGLKSIGVTATTGIAAVNIKGQTLHSFAGLTPQTQYYETQRLIKKLSRRNKVKRRWREIQSLVIDEGRILEN